MAATELQVILEPPATPNLKELAASTFFAFRLLRPWCESEYSSNALKSIKHQAQAYVKAIDSSIIAAQHGFNIAEDVLNFASLIEAGTGTEVERQEYLLGMLSIARRGEQNAMRSQNSFRDVRAKVYKLIHDATEENSRGGSDTVISAGDVSELNNLKEGVLVLEKFSKCLSFYISWWNVMRMTHATHSDRLEKVVINYDSLRYRNVVEQWRDLRRQYVDYTDKIKAIQDADPQFAIRLAKARTEDDQEMPTSFEQSTESLAPLVNPNNKPTVRKSPRKRDRLLRVAHRFW